jgi:hypothetical protein
MKRILPTPPQATHLCVNAECSSREWHAEADATIPQLWYVRDARRVFTIADHRPSCPVCGGALVQIATLETVLDGALVGMRSERTR